MADTPNLNEPRKDLEKQISELREEMESLKESIAERAQGLYSEASRQARGAAKQVRDQAQLVSEAARENPGTAATVLSSAGIIGFLIGLAVGQAMSSSDHSYRRWY